MSGPIAKIKGTIALLKSGALAEFARDYDGAIVALLAEPDESDSAYDVQIQAAFLGNVDAGVCAMAHLIRMLCTSPEMEQDMLDMINQVLLSETTKEDEGVLH